MATATGDFVVDFTDLSDVSPYTNPNLSFIGGNVQIIDGSLRTASGAAAGLVLSAAVATEDIIRTSIETGWSSSYNSSGFALRIGTNNTSFTGYFVSIVGDDYYIRSVFTSSNFIDNFSAPSYSAGTVISFELQVSTGRLEIFHDNVSVWTATNTDHTQNLRPGVYMGSQESAATAQQSIRSMGLTGIPLTSDYTARKGSTLTVTHTLPSGSITTATLNGEALTIASQSGQAVNISFTDAITTSGVYDLVLSDGTSTETFDVQYNLIGLTTNTIQKEGVSIGARSDLEIDVLNATGSTVLGTLTGLTTDAAGITGQTIVPAGAAGDAVRVSGYSEAAGIGFAYKTTLGLL